MPTEVARRLNILSGPEDDVTELGSGKLTHRVNIDVLKIRIVLQNIFLRDSSRKKSQQILHPRIFPWWQQLHRIQRYVASTP